MGNVPWCAKAMDRVVGRLIVGIHHDARSGVSGITPAMARFRVDLPSAVSSVGSPTIENILVMEASTAARILVRWHAWTIEVARLHIDPAMMTIAAGHLPATKPIIAGAWARGVGRRRIDASNFSKYWKKFRG